MNACCSSTYISQPCSGIPWEIFAFCQALRNFKRRVAYAAKGEENEIPFFNALFFLLPGRIYFLLLTPLSSQ
jgi:hypothetical protein